MSDFKLDVDSPYPLPTRQDVMVSPRKMHYTQSHIPYKHYGKYVGRMLKGLGREQNGAGVAAAVTDIFRFMRAKSYEYNREHPNNEVIVKDLKRMSDYGVEIDEAALNNFRSDYKQFHPQHPQQGGRNQKRPSHPVQKNRTQQQRQHQQRPNFQRSGPRHNMAKQ